MPWKEHGVMEERLCLVEEWKTGDSSMAELCRYYGVTRATGYKWIERYELGGLEALRAQSRAPHRHPNEVAAEMEDLVIAVREKHPSWGYAHSKPVFEAAFREYGLPERMRTEYPIAWQVRRVPTVARFAGKWIAFSWPTHWPASRLDWSPWMSATGGYGSAFIPLAFWIRPSEPSAAPRPKPKPSQPAVL